MGFWVLHTLHILGIDDTTGPWYAFWSGFGSDLGELAIVFGLVTLVRKHNCHVTGCWRLGRLPVEGTAFLVCQKHHPKDKITVEDVNGG